MSIAEKLQTIAENEPKVYNAGRIATLKDSKYMNGKESGAIVSVNDVTPIEHNVGVKVASKNLFPFGDITISGRHINGVRSDFLPTQTNIEFLRGKVIRCSAYFDLSGAVEDTATANVTVRFYDESDTIIYQNFGNILYKQNGEIQGYSTVVPRVPENAHKFAFALSVYFNGTQAPDPNSFITVSKGMVTLGADETEYTPYISNFAGGENLIPYPYPDTTKTMNGITFTDDGDGSITINGTAAEESAYFNIMETKAFSKGNYILSGNSTNGDMVVFLYGAYGSVNTIVQRNGTDATFSLTEDTEVNISFHTEEGASYNNVTITPQIVRTDTIKTTVRKCGANLFPFGESVKIQGRYVNGVLSAFLPKQTDIEFLRGKLLRYGAYFDISGAVEDTTQASVKIIYFDDNGTILKQYFGNALNKADGVTQGYSTISTIVPQNAARIDFCISVMFDGNRECDPNSFAIVSRGMATLGSNVTEYEPYTETIYTANADGTVEGVKSISPNMTLIPNNNAVTVECEYLRDIDLYIDNLLKSVAMIGGE